MGKVSIRMGQLRTSASVSTSYLREALGPIIHSDVMGEKLFST